ncbi:hypothetical protein, partial [Nocardiopsis lucentensis]|uniref:hypothetical protein n=1 Tax=Nocardiopsis lucentensis TaxID=53441 RepID=UPI001F4D2FC0
MVTRPAEAVGVVEQGGHRALAAHVLGQGVGTGLQPAPALVLGVTERGGEGADAGDHTGLDQGLADRGAGLAVLDDEDDLTRPLPVVVGGHDVAERAVAARADDQDEHDGGRGRQLPAPVPTGLGSARTLVPLRLLELLALSAAAAVGL